MNDFNVTVVHDDRSEDGELALTINGERHRFKTATDKVSARLVSPIPDRLLDLIDIASTVFATDSSIRRGGDTRAGFGEDWRRQICFTIPVREPEFWNASEVREALVDATEFMTEDRVSFNFVRADVRPRFPVFLDFNPAHAFRADDVIMFSGGLDSLSGVVERLATTHNRIALVTHLSAQKRMPHQTRLVEALQTRFPSRILWVPIKATRQATQAVESTQRSRSLLYAALGYLICHMLGATQLSFFENGVVSQNLPISPQVIGTMATRTTHPLSLQLLGVLLSRVAGRPVSIANPFAWLTKTEVITRLRDHGAQALIPEAISCSTVFGRTLLHTHCGACSQCLDRRMAILASGMAEQDPPETYETEVMTGPRERELSRTLALDWTRQAHALSTTGEIAFVSKFGSEIGRIVEGLPDKPNWQTARDIVALHRRQGRNVRKALTVAVSRHAEAIVSRTLPETSLLRMFITELSGSISIAAPPAFSVLTTEPGLGEIAPFAADLPRGLFPLRVVLEEIGNSCRVTVLGLGTIRGAPAGVVKVLKPQHDEDGARGLAPEQYRFTGLGVLAQVAGASKELVTQHVRRCRSQLAEQYREIEGVPPARPLLIERRAQKGYRLDPHCSFVDSAEPT